MKKISVLVKRPGEPPRHVNMSNTLENFQRYVGGYIETVTIFSDVVIICNEEGRLLGLPWNCEICGIDFCGDIIMCGVDGDEFADMPGEWKKWKRLFPDLWEVPA